MIEASLSTGRKLAGTLPALLLLTLIFAQIPDKIIMGIAHIPFIRFYQIISVGIFGPVAELVTTFGEIQKEAA